MQRKNERFPILVTALSTAASRVLGFLRYFFIAYFFGAGKETDVLHLVFSLVNNLRKIIGEGIFSSAVVPVLTNIPENAGGVQKRIQCIHNLFLVQLCILIPFILLFILFPQQIITTIFSFPLPEQEILAVSFLRTVIVYALMISLCATFIAVLHAHKRFFVTAINPLVFSMFTIASMILLHKTLGILSLAVGAVVGSIVQVCIYIPQYRKLGYTLKLSWTRKSPHFNQLLKNSLPLLLISLCSLASQQVSISIASTLDAGSGTSMANALVFFQLPIGIFSTTLLVVFFPLLTTSFNTQNFRAMGRQIEKVLTALLYLQIPVMLIFILWGRDIISLVLQWGSFTAEAGERTYTMLWTYSLALPGVSLFMFMQRLCFASKRFTQSLYITIFCVSLDIILTLWLKNTFLKIQGIALAYCISYTTGALIMLVYLRKTLPYFSLWRCSIGFIKSLLCSVLALIPFLFIKTIADTKLEAILNLLQVLGFLCILVLIYRLFSVDVIGIFNARYIQEEE